MQEIDEAETKLSEINTQLKEDSKKVIGRRNRRTTPASGKASERQVAKAVGEKPKLTKEQEEAKKVARKLQKEKEAKQKVVEKSNDLALLAKRRQGQTKSLEHLVSDTSGTSSSAGLRLLGSRPFPDRASTFSNTANQNAVQSGAIITSNAAQSVIIRNHSDTDGMSSEDDDVTFDIHPKVNLGIETANETNDNTAVEPPRTCQSIDPSLVNTIIDLSKYGLIYDYCISLCVISSLLSCLIIFFFFNFVENPNTEKFLMTLVSIFSMSKPSRGNINELKVCISALFFC